jgi:hypothetical protein
MFTPNNCSLNIYYVINLWSWVHFYNIIVKKGLFKRIRIRPLVTFRAHLQQPALIAQCFPIQDIFHSISLYNCNVWSNQLDGCPGLAMCWMGVARMYLLSVGCSRFGDVLDGCHASPSTWLHPGTRNMTHGVLLCALFSYWNLHWR